MRSNPRRNGSGRARSRPRETNVAGSIRIYMVFFLFPGRVCFDSCGLGGSEKTKESTGQKSFVCFGAMHPIIGWIVAAGRFWPIFGALKRGGAASPNMTYERILKLKQVQSCRRAHVYRLVTRLRQRAQYVAKLLFRFQQRKQNNGCILFCQRHQLLWAVRHK
jgi:hypothetical protein